MSAHPFASQVLFQPYALLAEVTSFPGVLDVQGQVIPFIFGGARPVHIPKANVVLGFRYVESDADFFA